MLYVTPSREDLQLGLVDHHSKTLIGVYSSPPHQQIILVPSKSVPTLGVSPHQGDIHTGMGGGAVGGGFVYGYEKYTVCNKEDMVMDQ